MRKAILLLVISLLVIAMPVLAEDAEYKGATAGAVAAEKADKPGAMHHIDTDTGDDSGETADRPEDYEGQELPSYESYDPNTGLTDETQSDAAGNLN
ncbi:MAG TPA: hypothetical protein PLV52_01525 [Candidatus Omnitrophota bacterium]|nr:hypothetical protein [Candidatus Omnitrophota bacterium]